jgi:hypothetical protein
MSFKIPDGVTSIGEYAFSDCSSLTSIKMPDSVTSIGSYAFYNCSKLTAVYYGGANSTAWSKISIGSANTSLTGATRYYYSETQQSGNYWHWVDGAPTKW